MSHFVYKRAELTFQGCLSGMIVRTQATEDAVDSTLPDPSLPMSVDIMRW